MELFDNLLLGLSVAITPINILYLMAGAMIGMIIGERPVSDYDTVYEEWLKLGGDLVNDEVNEWWASR